MAKGFSFESFAGTIRVCVDTINEWARVYPAFSSAKRAGSAACRLKWEQIGYSGTTGTIDSVSGIDGEKVQQAMWIYNMKCRFPKEWRDNVVPNEESDKKVKMLSYQRRKQDQGKKK